ncbi:MAG: PKD domain-containing protein, partial [Mycetocola sp.]
MCALGALVLGGVVFAGGTPEAARADTAPPSAQTPATVGAQSLPTTQINGVAWTQVVVGDTVFVGGEFSSARPAGAPRGTNETPRSNLLSYRLSTGELIEGFAPQVNGAVRTLELSPEGDRLYVGGNFTAIDGAQRYRFAVYNPTNFKAVTNVQPTINARVDDIAVTSDRIYIVGKFTSANRQQRDGAAVFDRATGAIQPWAPTVERGAATSVEVSPDGATVAMAGNFNSINRRWNTSGIAGVAADNSATVRAWPINRLVTNNGKNALVSNLAGDGGSLYGTASSHSVRTALEGAFKMDWNTGQIQWVADCHGDAYSIAPHEGAVYVSGHSYYCGNFGGMPQSTPPPLHSTACRHSTEPTST